MTSNKQDEKKEIPEIIHDPQTNCTYQRLRFFGKGGFAKCYEIQDLSNNQIYAGKIVSKKLMVKSSQKEKMAQEIAIHRSLLHKHVVGFHSFFEDSMNIYIILLGVQYLHSKRIIHRDLKLGNLFLDDDLRVKIEILTKKGHSFEVDIWSLGCIMYTLLVGKPPFETSTLKDTYKRIKQCEYMIPSSLRKSAGAMIMLQLQAIPARRPSVDALLQHDFFTSGILPAALPVSCLTTAPRTDQLEGLALHRRPLNERDGIAAEPRSVEPASHRKNLYLLRDQLTSLLSSKLKCRHECLSDELSDPAAQPLVWVGKWVDYSDKYGFGYQLCDENIVMVVDSPVKRDGIAAEPRSVEPASHRKNLYLLRDQLTSLLSSKLKCRHECLSDELSDPAAQPLVWVGKWVDYSDKYGFGYQLCDESVGVMNVHYITRQGQEQYMTMREYPLDLDKKMKLLTYFRRYMTEHLMKAGASVPVRESDGLSRLPHLHQWFRTTLAVIMYLTNGTLQINFQDHTKIILCPLMQAVTYIDVEKNFRTFRFSTIEENGCDKKLFTNLTYALEKLNSVLANKLC
ncbi:Serine/threonine protein kinase [Operophtera brumata]|uniref:polo kinase n=1 Tax=Operophtera brumata TaxID=104452 RepID=A0A0L7L1E0_OPEBR|nr:Serine/threonine protein kinase [Operophtera brumata]